MSAALSDKWVLITGASSGFGAAAAEAFARQGSRLVLAARRRERLEEVAATARAAGAPTALVCRTDVTDEASVSALGAFVRAQCGRLDVLVNNAGLSLGLEPVASGVTADWRTMLDTNVLGLLLVTRAMLPLLTATPGSTIVNIGSVAGHVAYEGGAAYCAAKAGELQITRALRLELCGTGVRVCTIDPGMAETEFSLVRFKGDAARAKKVYEGMTPLSAADVADTIVWVASRPSHVTIDEVLIKATDQAAVHKVHRRSAASA
jgi:NADP-dependent 3-hydroxy acid dehydrogenase YdfG